LPRRLSQARRSHAPLLDLDDAAAPSREGLLDRMKFLDDQLALIETPQHIERPGLLHRLEIPELCPAVLAVIHPVEGMDRLAVIDAVPRREKVQLRGNGPRHI